MIGFGDIGNSLMIATINSIYPSVVAGRVVWEAIPSNVIGTLVANQVFRWVNARPDGVVLQAMSGQGVGIGITKGVQALKAYIEAKHEHHAG